MSNLAKHLIQEFILELTTFSSSDILVNILNNEKALFKLDESFQNNNFNVDSKKLILPHNSKINQILKIAINFNKSSDIQSLCLASSTINWKFKEKKIVSPLVLFPVQVKLNKISKNVEISYETTNYFINPFIINNFKKEFDLELNDINLENHFIFIENFKKLLKDKEFSFEIESLIILGNFHYHRFDILKDLEEMNQKPILNPLLNQLLGDENQIIPDKIDLTKKNCFESDTDQEVIFNYIKQNNCIVQGPPGTGKSQFIANLISKLLYEGSKNVMVSEKRTALSVIEEKLKTKNLHYFVNIIDSTTKSSDIINKLKKCWHYLENEVIENEKENYILSEQLINQVQLIFDVINSNSLFKLHTLSFFQKFENQKEFEEIEFCSDLPNFDVWEKYKNTISIVYQNIPNVQILSSFKINSIKHHEHIDRLINSLYDSFIFLHQEFKINSLQEIDDLLKLSTRIQLLNNEIGKKYFKIINSKSQQNKFLLLKRKYDAKQKELVFYENELSIWKNVPTLSEIQTWKEKKKLLKKGFYGIKKRIFYNKIKVKLEKEVSIENALEYTENFYKIKNEIKRIYN